ncbi:MAG: hypothetical protein LBJ19_02035 [Holosporaceae bacterium]|jgi:hypothetical protein|nr:hypothetical protein [Holosporaceae bacterium]
MLLFFAFDYQWIEKRKNDFHRRSNKESSVKGRQIFLMGKLWGGSDSEYPVRVFEAFSKLGGIVLAHILIQDETPDLEGCNCREFSPSKSSFLF